MTHLTLCGPLAGTVLCGEPKTTDNVYLHAMWAPQAVIDSEDCCPSCRNEWEQAAE